MRSAAAALQRLRAARAALHRRRHGWPEEMPTPQPEAGDEIEGLTCAWAPPQPGKSPRPKPRQPTFDETRLPEYLIAKLRFVDYRTRRIWLHDGSSVEDLEHRLRIRDRNHDAIRLMVAQARLKQWSGISAQGDANFLRAAARLAFAEGIEIAGRDAEMDRIVQEELDGLRAAQAEAGTMHDASGTPDVSSGAEAREKSDVESGTKATEDIPWFEQEMDMETLFARVRAMTSGGPKPDADADADGGARPIHCIRAHLLDLLDTSERQLGRKTGFNADALARYLRFAKDPATNWPGNLRDLQASAHRMAVLAERGRITLPMVESEIATLCAQWQAADADGHAALLHALLPDVALDEFDSAQLAAVIRACRDSASLSAAGRRLFAVSRAEKAVQNDADRLRKYLSRFGLDWAAVTGNHPG